MSVFLIGEHADPTNSKLSAIPDRRAFTFIGDESRRNGERFSA
jgi:hypothetical protein